MNRNLFAAVALAIAPLNFAFGAEKAVLLPPPMQDVMSTAPTETAVFAGGCFWDV
jgi:peptide-methionine (S)-S-oxide reductase